MTTIRLSVVGAQLVGKSSLVIHYIRPQPEYLEYRDRAVVDCYTRMDTVDNKHSVVFHIMDTFDPIPEGTNFECSVLDYKNAFIIVYNMCSVESFQTADTYLCYIKKIQHDTPTPIVVVATHADLAAQRTVSEDDGRQFAMKCGIYASYIELALLGTDFKEGNNESAKNVFFELARLNRRIQKDDNVENSSDKRIKCTIN